MIPVDPKGLRLVMRRWTSGVTVVSVQHEGISHGMTVSSFTSISLNPATIIVSLRKTSRTHGLIIKEGKFGISLLSVHQRSISERFAGEITEFKNRFDNIETFTLVTGAPLIKGGLAFMDCKLIAVNDFGMNSLLFGEVLTAKVGDGRMPLLYFDQRYHRLQE